LPKIKINIFGEGLEIRQIQLDPETHQQWTEIALKKKQSLPALLLDPFFYYELKDNSISSLLDLNAKIISGVLDKPKSQIEIWFNRYKLLKLKPNELFNEMLLFPLYHIENDENYSLDELEAGIYIIKKEIGLIASLELQIDSNRLEIDEFTFTTSVFQNEQFLTEIKYQNQSLKHVKNDTLTTNQTGFEISY
jgi:hypothetical protein